MMRRRDKMLRMYGYIVEILHAFTPLATIDRSVAVRGACILLASFYFLKLISPLRIADVHSPISSERIFKAPCRFLTDTTRFVQTTDSA